MPSTPFIKMYAQICDHTPMPRINLYASSKQNQQTRNPFFQLQFYIQSFAAAELPIDDAYDDSGEPFVASQQPFWTHEQSVGEVLVVDEIHFAAEVMNKIMSKFSYLDRYMIICVIGWIVRSIVGLVMHIILV